MNRVTEHFNEWVILPLDKDFTASSIITVRAELERIEAENAVPRVAFDFTGVDSVDSSSINLMFNFSRRVAEKNGKLVIFGVKPEINDVFKVISLEDSVSVFATRRDFEQSMS